MRLLHIEKCILREHIAMKKFLQSIKQSEQFGLVVSLLVICIIASFLSPMFFTVRNIMNVLRAASLIAITGVGMVFVILTGEIDLSVGSTQALVGIIAVTVLNATGSFFLAFMAAMIAGVVIGLVNGLLITKAGINSLIATLATMAIIRGVSYVSTQAVSIQANDISFSEFGAGYIGPFPIPLLVSIIVILAAFFVFKKTIFGRYVYAVGGSENASEMAGINVNSTKRQVYLISGVLTALSAFILASRLNSGQPNAGIGFEFQVIASVILGGISLKGGKGSVVGAMIGVVILSIVSNILVLKNVSPFYHEIARGLVILFAVYLDVYKAKSEKRLQKSAEVTLIAKGEE